MEVISVFQVADALKPTYVAFLTDDLNILTRFRCATFNLLSAMSAGNCFNIVKYSGDMLPINVEYIMTSQLLNLSVKTVRSKSAFASVIKPLFQNVLLNPVYFENTQLVYDSPFLYYNNGQFICAWKPYFEESLTSTSLKPVGDGEIVEYSYKQPIFILDLGMRRHAASFNIDNLLVNVNTGEVTRKLCVASDTLYREQYSKAWRDEWVCLEDNKKEIAGYKLRS